MINAKEKHKAPIVASLVCWTYSYGETLVYTTASGRYPGIVAVNTGVLKLFAPLNKTQIKEIVNGVIFQQAERAFE